MLNRLYHFIALAADATEASEVATTLAETEYAGSTVPAGTTVLFIAGLFLLAAAAIAVTMYLRNHVKNWAYPIYAGAIFYLLFSYIIIQGLYIGLTFLPAVKEYAEAHDNLAPPYLQMILYGARILTDSVAFYLGMRYYLKTAPKRNVVPVIGHAVSFGLACYIAYIFISSTFSGYFQNISVAGAINNQGYQSLLTDAVLGDTYHRPQVFWEGYLNLFVEPRVWRILFSTFVDVEHWQFFPGIWPTMVMIGVYIAAAVMVYGFQTKKLGVKWLVAAFVLIALIWIPYIPSISIELPVWSTAVWYTVLLALSVLALYRLATNELKEDMESFKYSRAKEQQKVYQEAHKMPKIVMPRDEDLQPVGSAGVNTDSAEAEEARKAAEETFGMTEEEAEALMAEEADASDETPDSPEDNGREERS